MAVSQFAGPLCGQQETSAALSGVVMDRNQAVVGSVQVVVDFLPTGGRCKTETNTKGLFSLSGLPVGGPYTLAFESAGYEPQRLENIALGLGETRSLEIVLAATGDPTVRLEKMEVLAPREALGSGPRTTLSRDEIENQPSVEGSLNEFAARDPRVVYIDPDRGELSAAGQNSRYNSLSVDGVPINDQFGITPNGFPSQGNPLSLETVEAVNVEVSPYDVHRGGFTGASINAVTKSGTNRFRGSIYYYYRDQNWAAKNPVTGERDPFTDETFGVTLGGPLWPDHLFFFSGYEHAQRIEPERRIGAHCGDSDPAREHLGWLWLRSWCARESRPAKQAGQQVSHEIRLAPEFTPASEPALQRDAWKPAGLCRLLDLGPGFAQRALVRQRAKPAGLVGPALQPMDGCVSE
jgi:hypothetical protein